MTGEKYYNVNAWRYYSEYGFHMYAWMFTKNHHGEVETLAGDIADSAYHATVETDQWEFDKNGNWSWRNLFYIALGLLGM